MSNEEMEGIVYYSQDNNHRDTVRALIMECLNTVHPPEPTDLLESEDNKYKSDPFGVSRYPLNNEPIN